MNRTGTTIALSASLLGAIACVGAVGLGGPTPLEPSAPPPGGASSSAESRQDPADVLHYWTDERMADAEPAPMPDDG
ncbi:MULTISPECIES: hypothetical protein [Streptomyces]|uniref:hypothetical protein n=1 Tax=Streptomyces TaxID=1883 RepID=UPI002248DEED|nr:hypothetical protein [Streptomyces sp. JHD 1]MCX2969142.1 hypothetical protein [Streptomyces sp. JHD 1]